MSAQQAGRSQELEDAFALFTRMSKQLEASYQVLENRVADLSEELAAARSERLQQLAEKERLANRLQRLLELLPGGVVVMDGEGVVCDCNPAAANLLGEPLLGVRWHDIIARSFAPDTDSGSEVTLRNGRRVSISLRSLDPEPGQIVLLTDVTDQHALGEMLNRHRRLSAMGEMVASLAHQVRTPLASALLYASQLASPVLDDSARTRFTDRIVGRLRHLERMVNDMLQFARGGSFEKEDFAVQDLLDDLVKTLEPQLQVVGGQLDVHNRAPGACMRGNREALQSAILNLATNALQACREQPQLRLEICRDGPEVVEVVLRDNGPGIPEEVREKVFTPFFTTRPDGTGLGLPVVRAIVLAHEGDLWMRSEVGAGTAFGIRIPAGGTQALHSGDSALQSQPALAAKSA